MAGLSLPDWALELITESRVGHLGLIDDAGRPRVLPVTFAFARGSIWTAVDSKPKRDPGRELARVRWLRARPEAALLVDHYSDDWSQLAWVQLVGPMTVLDRAEPPVELVAKYDRYATEPPHGPVLRLDPEHTAHWRAGGGS